MKPTRIVINDNSANLFFVKNQNRTNTILIASRNGYASPKKAIGQKSAGLTFGAMYERISATIAVRLSRMTAFKSKGTGLLGLFLGFFTDYTLSVFKKNFFFAGGKTVVASLGNFIQDSVNFYLIFCS